MKCPQCQAENPTGMRFCGQCAASLEVACPSCGATNPPENKFCGQCATPLGKLADSRFASPDSYTPKHLAEKILTSKSALEGERKQVTVLFADLKGSMELLADRDPEEAKKLLDPVLEHMMEAVHRYEGTVNQVMGDGIMALFGAPLAHEDHAVRACYAALRMQETVKRYGEDILRTHGVTVRIRVGLNSGEVVVRAIGSDLHMDYTAVGQTTHLAARMEQLADPGTILLAPATLQLAEGYVEVTGRGPVPVKGLSGPVEVYELVGAGAGRSRFRAGARRGLTRFIGRDSELDQLRQALERAGAGHGQVVAIVGEPGVGKSRLYWEFARSRWIQGWQILESGSVSYGKTTPYLPVSDLLKAYFQLEGRGDMEKMREKVTSKVLSLDHQLEPVIPGLLSLLDIPVEDAHWERLDPPRRRQWTLDGIKRLLLRESQVQPLIVFFEDLHWIDTETQAVLDKLVESIPSARLLLLLSYRPEYQHSWGSKTYYRQLRIDPLPPESADGLLAGLLGTDLSLESLKRTLMERTEGNPLFLEESTRTLVETKILLGERGAYRLAKDAASIQMPPTVQAILAARIDHLPSEDKRLLQAASVIGKEVPFNLLQAIADLPEDGLHQGLARLQTAEFLYEGQVFPDLAYTFKHALTHEVAYGSLLQDRRRTTHARIMEAIETLYSERKAEALDRLAHHAFRGEAWDKAITYLRQAGEKAFTRSAYREAVSCFTQALTALHHVPETRETLNQAVHLRLHLINPLFVLGENAQTLTYLTEAEAIASAIGDQRALGRISSIMGQRCFISGEPDRAVEYSQRALAIAAEVEDVPLRVRATFFVGQAYFARGSYQRAVEVLQQSADFLVGDLQSRRFGLPEILSVASLIWLVMSLTELGRFAEGIEKGEEALRIAQGAHDPVGEIEAYFALGGLYLLKGELRQAVSLLEQALDLCQSAEVPQWFASVASLLGAAHGQSGRLAEGIALLERGTKWAASTGMMVAQSLFLAHLSEVYLLAGRIRDAMDCAILARDAARSHKERGREASVQRVFGEIHQQSSKFEDAESNYHQAIALADELGMRPLLAHCHLGLGKLYRRTGKREQAQEHLATAQTMYREMSMTYWLEQAETKLSEIR